MRQAVLLLVAVGSSALVALSLAGCALVPRESVELSVAVGRDIDTVRQSHRQMAVVLFSRMKDDVNRFVDDVYAPYQIQFVLRRQKDRQLAGDTNNMFSVLDSAMDQPENAMAQTEVLEFMSALVEAIYADVETYRQARLAPLDGQEAEVLGSLERAYDQIVRGNAAVTAHLSSVVKVNDMTDELLSAAGLEGLREKIGITLSDTSDKIANFVDSAERVDAGLEGAAEQIDQLTGELDRLTGEH
jgi:hypothetical protein